MNANLRSKVIALKGSGVQGAERAQTAGFATRSLPEGRIGGRFVNYADRATCGKIAAKFAGTFSGFDDEMFGIVGLNPQRIRELSSMASDYMAACAGKPRETKLPSQHDFRDMERAVFEVERKKAQMAKEGKSLELTEGKIRQIFEKLVSHFSKLDVLDATRLEELCQKNGVRAEVVRAGEPREEILKWGATSPFWNLKSTCRIASGVLEGRMGNPFDAARLMRIRNIVIALEKIENGTWAREESVQAQTSQNNGAHKDALLVKFSKIPGGWLGTRCDGKLLARIKSDIGAFERGEQEALPESTVAQIKRIAVEYEQYCDGQRSGERGTSPIGYDERFDFEGIVNVGFTNGARSDKRF